MAIFRWTPPPIGGVECRWGRQKWRFLANGFTACCQRCDWSGVIRRRRTTVQHFVTLVDSSKRRSLLMAGDDDEMFMTRSLNLTPKTTKQHLIVRIDKSVAYVTNNKRLRSTLCTIKGNYRQTQSIARPLCDSRASCNDNSGSRYAYRVAMANDVRHNIENLKLWPLSTNIYLFISFNSLCQRTLIGYGQQLHATSQFFFIPLKQNNSLLNTIWSRRDKKVIAQVDELVCGGAKILLVFMGALIHKYSLDSCCVHSIAAPCSPDTCIIIMRR